MRLWIRLLGRAAAGLRAAELEVDHCDRREQLRGQANLLLRRCDLVHLVDEPAGLGGDALQQPRRALDQLRVVPPEILEDDLEDAFASAARSASRRSLPGPCRTRQSTILIADAVPTVPPNTRVRVRRLETRESCGLAARQVDDRRSGAGWRRVEIEPSTTSSPACRRRAETSSIVVGAVALRSATNGLTP